MYEPSGGTVRLTLTLYMTQFKPAGIVLHCLLLTRKEAKSLQLWQAYKLWEKAFKVPIISGLQWKFCVNSSPK